MEDLTWVSEFSVCIHSCKMKQRWKLWVHCLIYPSWERHTKSVIPVFLYCFSLLLLFSPDCLWPYGLQHARLPCPPLSPGVCLNLSPLSWWCHPTISSSVVPFCFCLQSFPALESFSNESALCIRWPKYWSFIFYISPSLQSMKKLLIFHIFQSNRNLDMR